MFAVPEYNYCIPGGLKNALDWVSRPPATSPMRGKPIGLVGAATGMSGTIRAQLHLRQMLVYSDSPVMGQPEVLIPRAHERFAEGNLTDESTRQLMTVRHRVRRLGSPPQGGLRFRFGGCLASSLEERVVIAASSTDTAAAVVCSGRNVSNITASSSVLAADRSLVAPGCGPCGTPIG